MEGQGNPRLGRAEAGGSVKIKIDLSDEQLDLILRALNAHQSQTGRKPTVINIPIEGITVGGVQLHFYNGEHVFTCSEGKVVHHLFK